MTTSWGCKKVIDEDDYGTTVRCGVPAHVLCSECSRACDDAFTAWLARNEPSVGFRSRDEAYLEFRRAVTQGE